MAHMCELDTSEIAQRGVHQHRDTVDFCFLFLPQNTLSICTERYTCSPTHTRTNLRPQKYMSGQTDAVGVLGSAVSLGADVGQGAADKNTPPVCAAVDSCVELVRVMHAYQRDQGTTNQCVTNAMYLYDCLIASGHQVKAKAVIAWSTREVNGEICQSFVHHLVLQFDNDNLYGNLQLDPSYDVACTHPKYVDDYHQLPPSSETRLHQSSLSSSEARKCFEGLQEAARRINRGEFVFTSGEFYNAQADYAQRIRSAQ